MSRSRKHVTLGLDEEVQPPGPGQSIVRALGSRGSNLIAVEFPDGRQTLVLMPAKFNKKLWVKRGGYLLVEDSPAAGGDSKVTGTILSVLYDDQIKQLAKMPGIWPKEFASKEDKGSLDDRHASYLTGSKFPWEGCKMGASINRWTVTLTSYVEDPTRFSRACFRFGYKPVSQCTPNGLRCCGENHINKFKMYIDPLCQRSDIFNITVNNMVTTAAFKEYLHGDLDKPTFKITNMYIPFDKINTTTLCFSMKGNCPTLSSLANPDTRDQGVLEVGVYDKKVDNYECCTTGSFMAQDAIPSPMFVFPVTGRTDVPPPPPARAGPPPPEMPTLPPDAPEPVEFPSPPSPPPPVPSSLRPPPPVVRSPPPAALPRPPPRPSPPSPPPPPNSPPPPALDEVLSFLYGNFRYDVRPERLNFTNAQAACAARGGNLASFPGGDAWLAVQDALRVSSLISTLGSGSSLKLWIGLKLDLVDPLWTDGQPVSYLPTTDGGTILVNGACYSILCTLTGDVAADGTASRRCGWMPALPLDAGCGTALDGFLCKTAI
ncbi:hypothetical protein VOLCADRAFT_104609 [Volvox carteri f. nagariensis]|uniref:C-type lectin domain-containing protein n=1 Tax=Volvox carteri f. nagariensis TaxID=3068 RepID=D8TUU8_VOLCA|nr:uncharacterized protein VOLCADRAFT_104609 [Volvox carteri f. nagariensis]EFJ48885.1 hypothetical protein VOLCADRAFT_104609 [Volvox carteri f. nagariensis]|eukprot:XP_002950217.1 hypothetical protein VOLCADRAFT_104609 [Volvox carteri f. nagariensis]